MQTLVEQLAEALRPAAITVHEDSLDTRKYPGTLHSGFFDSCPADICVKRRTLLDRYRADPEEPCTAACDQSSEQHCTSGCPCYQAGANEGHSSGCNDDSCACWAAGHEAGYQARPDPEALLREAGQARREEGEELSVSLNRVRDGG